MKILQVRLSHDQLGNTGRKTGFWLEEFAAPFYVFTDAGIELTLASPNGGQRDKRRRLFGCHEETI
jgi:putative intracellular protease/amidase